MKAATLNFCLWALVSLVFSSTDSTKRKHIAVAVGNAIVTYDYGLTASPIVRPNVTQHNIDFMTYDPLYDALVGITTSYNRPTRSQWVRLVFRYDLTTDQVKYITELKTDDTIRCVAFDYFGNNLYMSTDKKIEVHSLITGKKTEFLYERESPHDILLIPEKGIMFVVLQSDYYPFYVRIARANMNGKGDSWNVLADVRSYGPKISLAYDKDSRKLFWVDEDSEFIYYADNAVRNNRIFRKSISEPADIAILGDKIFWTSRDSSILSWTDKKEVAADAKGHGVNIELPWIKDEVLGTPLLRSMDRSSTREMIDNAERLHPCSQNNGGCSHVCLVSDAKNRLCACSSKFYLDNSDMKTCKVERVNASSKNDSWINGSFCIGLVVGFMAFIGSKFLVAAWRTLTSREKMKR